MATRAVRIVGRDEEGNSKTLDVPISVNSPTTQGTLFGGSLAGDDGGLNLKLPIRRAFEDSWVSSQFSSHGNFVQAAGRLSVGGFLWMSYKGVDQQGSTGSRSTLVSFVQSATDWLGSRGYKGLLTFEHEHEIKNVIPVAKYHAGWDMLEEILEGNTVIEGIEVKTGFKSQGAQKSAGFALYDTYYRPNLRKLGFDRYNPAHGEPDETLRDMAYVWANLVEYAASKGKPLAIGETGAGQVAGRANWYRDTRAYLGTPSRNVFGVCAFDARDTLLDTASARAFYGV